MMTVITRGKLIPSTYLLLTVSIFPSLFTVFLAAPSMALGLLVALLPTIIFLIKQSHNKNILKKEIAIIFFIASVITAHLLISSIKFPVNINIKTLLSVVYLLYMLLTAIVVYNLLSSISDQCLNKSILSTFLFLSSLLVIKCVIIALDIKYSDNKAIFFFKEPSHFALIYSIFLTYFMVSKVRFKLIIFSVILASSIFIQSLALVVAAIMSLLLYSINAKNKLIFIFIFILGASVLIAMVLSGNANYFIERLTISNESENLSVLVFLSGFERAYLALTQSDWLGGGFQSMGNLGIYGNLENTIFNISGSYLNINDGGTLAAKMIFEFGIIGIFFLIIYLMFLFKSIVNFHLVNCCLQRFLWCAFFTLFLSLFVRGVGYFSPSVFFALCFIVSKTRQFRC